MSIAGGYYKAVVLAHELGCDCVQLFTKNNNQWRAAELTDEDAEKFRAAVAETGITHPIAHDSYLINLASPVDALWEKSVEALCVELLRADKLGLAYVVAHPGAFVTSTEAAGIARIVEALDAVHRRTEGIRAQVLLENTAGQGTNLGWRFEHLADIIAGVGRGELLGVCIDTCHTFAAGYPLGTEKEYRATIDELDRVVGLDRVKAFHLNDSKQPLGSRVDRHEHIGRGHLGLEPFRHLLGDPRFRHTPMYLETPKEQVNGEEMDVANLRTLRGLAETSTKAESPGSGTKREA
jgi:deoxyribonuclease IV